MTEQGEEKMNKENVEKGNKVEKGKTIWLTCGLIVAVIIFFVPLLNNLFNIYSECKTIIDIALNSVSMLLSSIIIIPILYEGLSHDDTPKSCNYIMVQLLYVILPLGLLGQYLFFDVSWVNITTLLIMLITTNYICKIIKKMNIKQIKYLKYANIALLAFFSIVCAIIGLTKEEMKIALFLACSSPLLVLRVVYEKILLQKENGEENKWIREDTKSLEERIKSLEEKSEGLPPAVMGGRQLKSLTVKYK
jgi:membrane protease YdiL (CAAX protease family)